MRQEVSLLFEEAKNSTDFFVKARILKSLQKDYEVRVKEMAHELDMKASYICHILRLNRLPEIVIDGYYGKLVSISHLFIIARLKSVEDMIAVYEEVLSGSLSAAMTEELVRERLYGVIADGEHLKKGELQELIDKIQTDHKGAKVHMVQTRVTGKIMIETSGNLKKTSETLRTMLQKLAA